MEIFSLLLAGLLANNCFAATGTGIDVTTSKFTTFKNATIYSVLVLCVGLLSGITYYVSFQILESYGLLSFAFFVALIIVAIFVQMAEFVARRAMPKFYSQAKYFVPILASTLFIFMFFSGINLLGGFWTMIITIIGQSLGLWVVLCLIAGVRRSCASLPISSAFNGNLLSLIIILVLMIIWTAF